MRIKELPIGTRIQFIKDLWCDATGDHPEYLYAKKNELGLVYSHAGKEGHMVTVDGWNAPFGAVLDEEFIEYKNEQKD